MIHRQLRDQLLLAGVDLSTPPAEPEKWQELLESISAYYKVVDEDRQQLEDEHQRSSKLYASLKQSAETELDTERMRLLAVTNALQSGVCAFSFDGSALFFNENARNLFLTGGKSLSLENVLDKISFYSDDEEDIQIEARTLLSVLEGGTELSNVHAVITTLERSIPCRCNLTPLQDGSKSKPYGFVLTFSDVSKEMRNETDRRLAESTFETREAILICDHRGRVLKTNTAFTEITGFEQSDIVGKNVRILRDPDSDLSQIREIIDSLRSTDGWEGEIYNRRKSGEVYPQWLGLTAVRNHRNKVTHYIAHFTDISELKAMETNLRDAMDLAVAGDKAKTEFLTTLSHELRTPINILLGMADLLKDTSLDNNQRHFLNTQQKAGQHLLHLIDEILNFVNADRQVAQQHVSDFDCRSLIYSITDMFKADAAAKGIRLNTHIDNEIPPMVRSNPQHLRQVLINLVNNAVKFTSSGSVSIYLNCVKPQHLAVSVSDTGTGIEDQHLETIFSPFTQVDNSLSRRHGGIGMGLAISKKLVENLGGNLWVESEAGRGSTFFFTIECHAAESSGIQPAHTEEQVETMPIQTDLEQNTPMILIAEDSDDNAMLIELYLQAAGYESMHARNGEEAVSMYMDRTPDLILMDIQMPEVDGYEATRRIRTMEKEFDLAHVPIIALTAHAMEEHKQQSIEAGCDLHLSKPVSRETLLSQLEITLSNTLSPA